MEEYKALERAVHNVASGHRHSPEGWQSMAVACNSINTSSVDLYGQISDVVNQGNFFPVKLQYSIRNT